MSTSIERHGNDDSNDVKITLQMLYPDRKKTTVKTCNIFKTFSEKKLIFEIERLIAPNSRFEDHKDSHYLSVHSVSLGVSSNPL